MNQRSGGPRRLGVWLGAWALLITGLHLWLNVDWSEVLNRFAPLDKRKLNIAYIPVT
jgi:hypothetical protein